MVWTLYTADHLSYGHVNNGMGAFARYSYLKNVQADGSANDVYVRMEAWRVKLDCWCNVGVVGWEGYRDFEGKSRVNLEGHASSKVHTVGISGDALCPQHLQSFPPTQTG